MARSSLRAKPYVVEIQRHYHLDERARKDNRGHPDRIHSGPRTSREGEMPRTTHLPFDRSHSNSLEYEDIHYQRNHLKENSHLKQPGRWSFSDNGGYGRVRGNTRQSPGVARPTEMGLMMSGEVVDNEHRERKNTGETKYQNRTVRENGPMKASYDGVRTRTNGKETPKLNRVSNDKKDSQIDDLELWIARQTSFPRKQDETSSQRIIRNDTTSHELVTNQSKSLHEKSSHVTHPHVSLKPPPRSQTSRSASPTSSVKSNQSGTSHVSHHSARSGTSEVSVKSILKKPNVGRVVLKAEPSSYTLCAVLSCILCFPFGIYALTKSRQVKEAVDENDYQLALSSSRKVKNFCCGVLLAYVGILAIAGTLVAVYFTTGKIF